MKALFSKTSGFSAVSPPSSIAGLLDFKKLAEDRENFKNLVLELLKDSTLKPSEDNINLAFNELNQIYALGRQK